MGILDKAKAQAQQLAEKGQGAAKKGQEKVKGAQAKRRADALLRDLGAAVFAEKTGKGTGQTASEIERLLGELREHETEHGTIDTTATANAEENAGGASTEGNFTLDED